MRIPSKWTLGIVLLLMAARLPAASLAAAPSFPGGLIIDHIAVRDFDAIPPSWLDRARQLTLHYAHTSHGSQIISGILALEALLPSYHVAVRESGSEGLPALENPPALRIYDGNPPETYITPALYWDSENGMTATRSVAGTGRYNFSMWAWCGQQSSNDTDTVNSYLGNLNQLESEYPDMRFIYLTGHTDGSDTPGVPGTLKHNNELVRQYARIHGKIVYDFADIESWDPAGNYYTATADDCSWCATWCSNHLADCQNLAASCAHSHPYNCKLKARAFWYMMARLAGWNGIREAGGATRVGIFRNGDWFLDATNEGTWDGCNADKCPSIGVTGDIPLVGDWNGTGAARVGTFRPSTGTFYLDYSGNWTWDGCGTDRCLQIGMLGDVPLVGDWNGSGTAKVGVFRPSDGTFYLDYDGSGTWDGCGTDRCLQIGLNGDIPLVGDWNGSGISKVGAFRPADGTFYLDYTGNGAWDGCGTDQCLQIGMAGDVPLVGDWNGTGSSKIGLFRPSDGTFYLDYNGSGTWDGCGTDRCLEIGLPNDIPLVGDWNGSGTAKVGVFRPSDGTFYLDYDGSGTWNGCGIDRCLQIGMSGDTPLVGKW